MNVFVNNQLQDIPFGMPLSDLLSQLNIFEAKGIAVAVNDEIVFKHQWDSHQLCENDKLTVIRATQGG
ncbi:MAG: sulfur carrier protein ThiS [Bacteroidota bacterium]|nr:sulfur carrier protein ThiS [Bacteroidota bacterium]